MGGETEKIFTISLWISSSPQKLPDRKIQDIQPSHEGETRVIVSM